jgi:hypothetical protein
MGAVGAGGDEDELGAPGGFAVTLEVQVGVVLVAAGPNLARRRVDDVLVGLRAIERRDHLAVRIQEPARMRMGPRARPAGI